MLVNNTKNSVLVSGSTGFLGRYVVQNFQEMIIYSIERAIEDTSEYKIQCDLSKNTILLPNLHFDRVIHIAGKAHSIPKTKEEEQDFFNVNLKGTKNLLSSLSLLSQKPNIFIFISTVAIYGVENGNLLTESTNPNPTTPYGKSKYEAEKLVTQYCTDKNISFFILRLPLVVGRNAPGNFGDMVNAIERGSYIRVKNNFTKKSIVWADDVAKLIVRLDTSYESGVYNLTDGYNPTFFELEENIATLFNKKIIISVPKIILKFVANVGNFLNKVGIKFPLDSLKLSKLLSPLTFDSSKAMKKLDWKPNIVIANLDKILN